MGSYLDVSALLAVLLVSLVAGAGLVAVYAVGLAGLSVSAATAADRSRPLRGAVRIAGRGLAGLCFALVVAGVGFGVYVLLAS